MNLIFDGFVIDFDKLGRPMGIEIYHDASKFVDIDRLKKKWVGKRLQHPLSSNSKLLRT